MHNRPDDITLPDGFTWDRVEELRRKWDIADNMVPVAVAPGVVAWGTINSVRRAQSATVNHLDRKWCCLDCSSTFRIGEMIAGDTLRCPHCRSANAHPADGQAIELDEYHGDVGTRN